MYQRAISPMVCKAKSSPTITCIVLTENVQGFSFLEYFQDGKQEHQYGGVPSYQKGNFWNTSYSLYRISEVIFSSLGLTLLPYFFWQAVDAFQQSIGFLVITGNRGSFQSRKIHLKNVVGVGCRHSLQAGITPIRNTKPICCWRHLVFGKIFKMLPLKASSIKFNFSSVSIKSFSIDLGWHFCMPFPDKVSICKSPYCQKSR